MRDRKGKRSSNVFLMAEIAQEILLLYNLCFNRKKWLKLFRIKIMSVLCEDTTFTS